MGCAALAASPSAGGPPEPDPARDLRVWYRQPALNWSEAFRLGNGRLGALLLGDPGKERIRIDELVFPPDSLISYSLDAGPNRRQGALNKETRNQLREVRARLTRGDATGAALLAERHVATNLVQDNARWRLAEATLELDLPGEVTDYRRELNLDTGLVRITYRCGQATFTRDALISRSSEVLALCMSCSQPMLAVRLRLQPNESGTSTASTPSSNPERSGGVGLNGVLHRVSGEPVYQPEYRYFVSLDTWTARGDFSVEGDTLVIRGARRIEVVLRARTERTFGGGSMQPDGMVGRRFNVNYEWLRQVEVRDHRELFWRARLDFDPAGRANAPTDERLAAVRRGAVDLGLAELYTQHLRYLLFTKSNWPERDVLLPTPVRPHPSRGSGN